MSDLKLSENALRVLESRYLAKDERGEIVETPEELFRRVARHIASAERASGAGDERVREVEEAFYGLMTSLDFLPNSPTLGNAGRRLAQLSACYVLPVPDSLEGIFDALKAQAMVHQSGGGTGFAFSRLRPEGSIVGSTAGVASGPVSFMRIFDAATEQIKQGGARRGANMAILRVDHPDIEKFITAKADTVSLTNFNISVGVTEAFLEAVREDREYDLIDPRTGEPVRRERARRIFDLMVEQAWRNGDPGMVFLDRMNASRSNPTPEYGPIESTNPCGEQPLYPYDSCTLGSINLARFVRRNGDSRPEVDWDRLAQVIPLCVRFLDNVLEVNRYPLPEIERVTKAVRRIGLGVMGWADLLYQLGVPYDSEEALALAERLMRFVQEHADAASEALAEERGVFPAWETSIYGPKGQHHPHAQGVRRLRNATRTTIAPTGTLSIIADCSGGIEPVFALAFIRQHYLDRKDPTKPVRLREVNRYVEAELRRLVPDDLADAVLDAVATGESLRAAAARLGAELPEAFLRVFVTAHEVHPDWHVRMQAAFQRYVDNAVSKTVNAPREATVEDVRRAYELASEIGCKGITVYRDGSRELQVLSHGSEDREDGTVPAAPGAGADGVPPAAPVRRRLPDVRQAMTHKFTVGEHEGYLTVGLYDDGTPGEIFVKISKEGSTVSGLMDAVALLTSMALQYGVPLGDIARKFAGTRFEPSGFTGNPELPQATSLLDYVFRWLERKFGPAAGAAQAGQAVQLRLPDPGGAGSDGRHAEVSGTGCPECGMLLHYAEGCLICRGCGYTKCG